MSKELTNSDIELGDRVQEIISGFQGTVIGRGVYLFQHSDYLVCPEEKDEHGLPQDAIWISEGRLKKL